MLASHWKAIEVFAMLWQHRNPIYRGPIYTYIYICIGPYIGLPYIGALYIYIYMYRDPIYRAPAYRHPIYIYKYRSPMYRGSA